MRMVQLLLFPTLLIWNNQALRAQSAEANVSIMAAGKTWNASQPNGETSSDLEFALGNLKALQIANVSAENLELLKEDQSNFATTKRYIQKFRGKDVLQAELLLIYDSRGRLSAINSSLVDENILANLKHRLTIDLLTSKLLELAPQGINNIESVRELYFPFLETYGLGYKFLAKNDQTPAQYFEILVINQGSNLGKIISSGVHDPKLHFSKPGPGLHIYLSSSVSQACGEPPRPGDLVVKAGEDLGKLNQPPYLPQHKKLADLALLQFTETDQYYAEKFDAPLLYSGETGFDLVLDCIGLLELVLGGAHYDHKRASFRFNLVMPFLGYQNASHALDVVAHEFTHAVISHSSGLDNKGLPGALNEHLADFFGETIQRHVQGDKGNQYTIGEDMLIRGFKVKPIRDMLVPSNSSNPQPEHWSKIDPQYNPATCIPNQSNNQCGVHILNGLLNKVMIKSAIALGFEKMETLLYVVMRHRLRGYSDFKDYRQQVLDECLRTLAESDCKVIKAQFTAVGL